MRMSAAQYNKLQAGDKSASRQHTGYQNREAGESFQDFINAACDHYWRHRIAHIKKTPDELKIICPEIKESKRTGRFLACYVKKSQPDYKGTLRGGFAVSFEAKHTTTQKINQDCITQEQWICLDADQELGAVCFVVVGFSMQYFYRIPWQVWKDMHRIFGYHHMKLRDLDQYRIPLNTSGILLLLDRLEALNVNKKNH